MVLLRELNDDTMEEILIRVANCKLAIQCSSVCKRWFSLIQNADFIERFNRRHADSDYMQYTLLFICFWPSEKPPYSLSFPRGVEQNCLDFLPFWKKDGKVMFKASCDGWLLVQVSSDLCVSNTLTKQWLFLPHTPLDFIKWDSSGLVCKDNNFKVVLAYQDEINYLLHTKVFCSESRRWTDFALPLSERIDDIGNAACSSDGILYFLGDWEGKAKAVVAYDPFNNTARCIGLPHGSENPNRLEITVIRGRICLMQLKWVEKAEAYTLKLWELQNTHHSHDNHWCFVHDLRPSLLPRNAYLIGFDPNNHDKMFFRCNDDVYCHDIAKNDNEIVGHIPKDNGWSFETITLAHPSPWPMPIPNLEARKERSKPDAPEKKSKKTKT